MALETFMEAAHLLHPRLVARGVRQVKYLDILECPPGVTREARIVCRRLQENTGGEVLCDVSISSQDITNTGRVLDRWTTNYTGQVVMGLPGGPIPDWLQTIARFNPLYHAVAAIRALFNASYGDGEIVTGLVL